MEAAVIDRIVDGKTAVLLVGEEETEVHVPVEALPAGAEAGQWLRVGRSGGEVVRVELDQQATEAARERIQGKLDELRRRGSRLD